MKKYLVVGLVLIALTNVVILTGVAYNRSEPHVNTIELSGREFRSPNGYGFASENSAKTVKLITRMPNNMDRVESSAQGIFVTPLTVQQLASLGLTDLEEKQQKADALFGENYHPRYQVEVYLALQFNGTEYQHILKMQENETNDVLLRLQTSPDSLTKFEVKNARSRLKEERDSASRLFYIDASIDSDTLVQKYKDQANVFVTKGQLHITSNKDGVYSVSYANLLMSQIMLPSEIAQTISEENLEDSNLLFTLHIGKRFEPWVSRIELVQ